MSEEVAELRRVGMQPFQSMLREHLVAFDLSVIEQPRNVPREQLLDFAKWLIHFHNDYLELVGLKKDFDTSLKQKLEREIKICSTPNNSSNGSIPNINGMT